MGKVCLILSDYCPKCLGYYFEVLTVTRIGNWLQRTLYCLKCGNVLKADELSILATSSLVNGGMEGGFREIGAPEVTIANGWEEWNTPITYWPGSLKRPESKPSTGLKHSGNFSQKQFHRYVLWRGGIQQKISVTAGEWYKFSCWAWVYCSERDDNVSKGGTFHARVGINPWGAWPHHYASVCGKEALKPYDRWVKLEVIAQAWSNEILVFTEGLAEHTVSHNDVYWDDATFEHIEFGQEPPQPEPEPDPDPQPPGECGFVNRWQEVLDNQAEILLALAEVPKHGDTVTL